MNHLIFILPIINNKVKKQIIILSTLFLIFVKRIILLPIKNNLCLIDKKTNEIIWIYWH